MRLSPLKLFQAFIRRNIEEDLPSSIRFGFLRFFIGLCYLAGHMLGTIYVSRSRDWCYKALRITYKEKIKEKFKVLFSL